MAEIAGLVLGVIPLVIEGLKIYLKSIETVQRYWRYKDIVSSLTKTLATERAIYRNNCILLLQDLVSNEELALLLEDPGGSRWKEEVLERKLAEALGESFRPYVDTLTSMNEVMESFKRKIAMEEGTVKWSDRKKFKSKWKKVIVALCLEETKDLLSELRLHNIHLETLLGQQAKMKSFKRCAPFKTREATRYATFFATVQDHARILYQTLKTSFGRHCGCTNMHRTELRLEARFQEFFPPATLIKSGGLDFRVLFYLGPPGQGTLSWNWKETIIRPARENPADHNTFNQEYGLQDQTSNSVPVPPTPVALSQAVELAPVSFDSRNPLSATGLEFNELCTKLCANQFPGREAGHVNLGVLVDDNRNENRLQIKLINSFDTEQSPISLLELLSTGDSLGRREDRLVLGLKLALSTLQLSRTPWISDEWRIEDILFVKQQNNHTTAMIQNPYISGPLFPDGRDGQVPCPDQAGSNLFQLRNRTLFNLGTILLELWFGKAIEALRPSQGDDSRVAAACKLVKELADDAGIPGENYAWPIRFCLSLDLGGNDSNSLDTVSFKEEVWTNIIDPLQEYLKSFSGKEIEQLLL